MVTVFVCGDVMPGRGVDQVLPHPGDPELREAYARDARAYVDLAEGAHGPIPRPAGFGWPWGDALRVLDGIPAGWAAAPGRPGVSLLPGLSPATADDLTGQVQAARRPGDVAVASIHWGPNWGYDVDADQVRFARALIDGGADLVHGHSSHHPRPIEVFRGKLILYGCGDCINDYEGIAGHRAYRSDLRLLYFASLEADTGRLAALRMAPMRARKMRLHPAPAADRQWLSTVLDQISRRFGSRVDLRPEGMLTLRPTR